jgi:hypothetical protein
MPSVSPHELAIATPVVELEMFRDKRSGKRFANGPRWFTMTLISAVPGEYPMSISREDAMRNRDVKVRAALSHVAPIWKVSDEYRPNEESVLFNVVYVNPEYGWINQRFKYDAFNDVLYRMGEKRLSEAESLSIQEQEPYILGEVATRVPEAPSYRPIPPLQSGTKG